MDWPENKKSFRERKNPVDIFFMKWYIIPGWYSDRSCTKECFFYFLCRTDRIRFERDRRADFSCCRCLERRNSMKIGFIGAGKVGFSLGRYFADHGADVVGYYSRTPESAKEAADFTNTKKYDTIAELLRDSDTLFLTVPDGRIEEVWDCMKNLDIKNKNICHCSGSISSAAFFDGEERGACVYSVHPLYAISDKYESWRELDKAYFTLEGSPERREEMAELLRRMGLKVMLTTPENKTLYHCGAVVVSNLAAGLYALGADILEACGFRKEDAQKALAPLFQGNAIAVAQRGPVEALTGPVERGDVSTMEKHIAAIKDSAALKDKERLMEVYLRLSERLVDIAAEKHPERDYKKITEVIEHEKHSGNIS